MIVCLDGSSSMAGDKEIWSKAVTLTLLDIARAAAAAASARSASPSAETPLQVLDLNPRERYAPDMRQVFALAEYFPGGGTDFQKPLDAALDCLRADAPAGAATSSSSPTASAASIPEWLRAFQAREGTRSASRSSRS